MEARSTMTISQSEYNARFLQCISFWHSSGAYSAITIFAILYTVRCIKPPLSMSSRREQEYSAYNHRNSNFTVLNMEMEDVNDEDYHERSMIKNDEDNYFDPDTILFSPNDRKMDNFKLVTNSKTYISFDEASAIITPKYPIKPLKLHPVELPESNFHPKLVQHALHKKLWPVDLVSRKLFIRDNK